MIRPPDLFEVGECTTFEQFIDHCPGGMIASPRGYSPAPSARGVIKGTHREKVMRAQLQLALDEGRHDDFIVMRDRSRVDTGQHSATM